MTDSELLAGLREGDDRAFDTIFRARYAALVRFAESILGDRGVAEEVSQDVMLELWRRRETILVDTSLQSYLFRSARNRALNAIRHEKVVQREEGSIAAMMTPTPSPDRDALEGEIDAAVREAVASLPPRCREVFALSRFHGLSHAEIATSLDISIKTVEGQMGKALRVLRERLQSWL